MAVVVDGIRLSSLSDSGDVRQKSDPVLRLEVTTENSDAIASVYNGGQKVLSINLSDANFEGCKASKQAFLINVQGSGVVLHFPSEFEMTRFQNIVKGARHNAKKGEKESVFTERTDEASAAQYFQFYGYLSQQQNMMQDYIRTSTYQKAMLQNHEEFRDKVVLDVGAGSGILSFFAVQAGAKRVYAIEASSIAEHAKNLVAGNKLSDRLMVIAGKVEEVSLPEQNLVAGNKLSDRIMVIAGKVEEVSLPEQVDIIISEPMGYMLFNERMLESYLHAKKWLKPGGNMYPTHGDIHIAPFTDDSLYMEQFTKANFWYQQSFHGVDLSPIREAALQEYLRQPIVDTFDIRICLAKSLKYSLDFLTTDESDLHRIEIPVTFTTHQSGAVHGLAFWFDVAFKGKIQTIWLSTSPTEPLTHWYQVRCLLRSPLYVKSGQVLKGKVTLIANNRQSYDIDIELEAGNSGVHSTNRLDLKNPFFHYTGQQPAPPTGSHSASPSDDYWRQTPMASNGYGDNTQTNSRYGDTTQTNSRYGDTTQTNSQGLAVQYVGQSNLIPLGMTNTDPISHTGVLPGGATQRQQTVQIPSSVGVVMGSIAFNQMLTTTTAGNSNGQQQGGAVPQGTNNGYSPFAHGTTTVQVEGIQGMQIGGQSGAGSYK